MIEIEEMKYKNLSEVKERINKNYEFIQQLESLIKDQATDMEKLMLITLVGYLYSLYIYVTLSFFLLFFWQITFVY